MDDADFRHRLLRACEVGISDDHRLGPEEGRQDKRFDQAGQGGGGKAPLEQAKVQAGDEASKILEQARVQIAAEKESALRDIRKEVALLSVNVAEKVLRKELDSGKEQDGLVGRFIDELRS